MAEDLESFADAGYILTENDLVVDIDALSIDQIKEMIQIFNIKTQTVWTNRGVHFYFKKPQVFKGARSLTQLGFEVEYKHSGNTQSITVKQRGKAREIENAGVREELPDFLKPDRKSSNLLGLEEGEGRNPALFKQRMHLGNTKHWKQIINFINNTIFATPLPAEEMSEILRDSVDVKAEKDGESKIADVVMEERKVVKYAHQLYFKEGHEYLSDDEKLRAIIYEYCPGQKTRYVDEVLKQMDYRAKSVDESQVFDIRLNNGILREGKFIPIEYDDFTPYSINLEYDPDATPVKLVDDYLDMLSDHDTGYQNHILEVLGHTLIVNKEVKRLLAKFFFFVGDGGNGKGTLLAIIRKILDVKNCGSLSIDNMVDERYLNSLQGKLTNLGDDVEDEAIDNKKMKILKNISSCDFISLRKLYADSVSTELTPTLIFTSNHILKSFEKGVSYQRRVEWLPMYNKPKHKSGTFITDVTNDQALKYWLKLIVDGYQRLYKTKKFTDSSKIDDFNKQYHEDNNTALAYAQDLNKEDDVLGKRSPEIYEQYEVWCEENGYNVQGPKLFKDTICTNFHVELKVKKRNKKSQRIFVEFDE
ncbi:hypothetical protein FD03_GL000603 [Companilactobacillus nodensis DSM 19682 = JCM 14932 = NBRC 107160]|uniref:SF3 helicase domain-containing protein n=2 Tax=Companilactobacillus nodensis TaxID=460870 RepID=A0A0R1KGA5_9LACO|nr:hypothetical protein FD03_GL000603 [Companilactobacillus nodensis DSM 19682 = JCM 14932 = NBRC 107160]